MISSTAERLLATLRLGLGLIFLWAFVDKLFGLGFTTAASKSWLGGTSPTSGFLQFGTQGPLATLFQSLSGSIIIDWLFMLGLVAIGLALTLGVALRLARLGGIAMMLLIYAAIFPPEHHPFIDEHIVYVFVLALLPTVQAGHTWGLGGWWGSTALVRRFPLLT